MTVIRVDETRRVLVDQSYYGPVLGRVVAWCVQNVRGEANAALALDPRNVDALVELANADRTEGHIAGAQAEFQRALAIDPSDASAHLDYGTVLPLKQGLAQDLEAVQLDPGNANAQNNLATYEQDLGEYAQALAPWLATIKLDPHSADSAFELALTYALLHRDADAVKAFDLAQPVTPLAKALVAAGRLSYEAALDPKLHAKALAAVDALRQRPDLDPFSKLGVIQLDLVLGEKATALALLPQNCSAAPVVCSDLGVNPLWLPLHGKPRFEALVKQYDIMSKPVAAASTAPASATRQP